MDYRVPVDQSMAAFNAAQALGVPSELLLFPEENHWILKPQNSVQWNRVFYRWLDKWLKE
jgi:dipeptidyl aminopeptidase/acylaminoacyl peptidase